MATDLPATMAPPQALRARVSEALRRPDPSPWYERPGPKAAIVLTWLVGTALLLALGSWPPAAAGALTVGLGLAIGCGLMTVGHSGTHRRTFGRGPTSAVAAQLASVGVTAAWWRAKHNVAHHGGVPDGGRAGEGPLDLGPFARLADDQPWRPWHRAQPVYFYLAFAVQHLAMIGANLAHTVTGRVDRHQVSERTFRHVVTQAGAQFGPAGAIVALASMRHGAVGIAVVTSAALVVSGVAMSLVLSVEVVHRGLARRPAARGGAAWLQWQTDVSMTILTPSRAAVWFSGGLNFHTEHHLFPKAPLHRLPEVQPVVAATCADLGLPYHQYPGFVAGWRRLHRHLVALSHPPAPPPASGL